MAWKLAGKYRGKNIGAGFCLESLFMFSVFACAVSVKSFEAAVTETSLAAVILTTQGTPKLMRVSGGIEREERHGDSCASHPATFMADSTELYCYTKCGPIHASLSASEIGHDGPDHTHLGFIPLAKTFYSQCEQLRREISEECGCLLSLGKQPGI